MRERIDRILVERKLAPSTTKAQAMIMAGLVLADEQRVNKPGEFYDSDVVLRIKGLSDSGLKYVGRGGLKLEAALAAFDIDVSGLRCLDIGASTGGFTDCLLKHGAARVVTVDVGHNQLDWRLRSDVRVECHEGVNARYMEPIAFGEVFPIAVMDVSFISAKMVLPSIVRQLTPTGRIITLIKPQFEVERGEVGPGGIVTEVIARKRVIEEVNQTAFQLGLRTIAVIESPITGAEGNVEFLALYERVIQ